MTLYDPLTATYLLITLLIFLFSGTLFDDLWTKHERTCHARNAALLAEGKQGPLRECR